MVRADVDTRRRPLIVAWELTQACDLTCEHCRADAQPNRHPDELTTTEGRDLLSSLREFGENQLVVLTGGDPIKRPDLIELIEFGTDIGLTMTITPSATHALTRSRIRSLKRAGISRMALSLDGPDRARHDAFRGEVGSFDTTVKAAKVASDLDIPIQINTTVCQQTYPWMESIATRVAGLGATLWALFFLVPVGRGAVLEQIRPEAAESLLHWAADLAQTAPFAIKTTEAPMFRRIQRQRHGAAAQRVGGRLGILAGDGFMFVSHTGDVRPSGFLGMSAGNVRNVDPKQLYRDSPLFRALRDRSNLRGKCGRCDFNIICGGSRSRAWAETGDPLAADSLCPYQPPAAAPQ